MAESFSLFRARESPVHSLHPLTKLGIAAFLLVSGLAVPAVWYPYALLIFAIFPLAAVSRVLHDLLKVIWRVALPFAISVFLIQGFLWPGGTPILDLGIASLKREGLIFAIASVGRVLIVVGAFLWFTLTTRPDMLMIALYQRGLPASLAYIIVATIQIIPRFQARANTILDAQRARGLETSGNLVQRARGVLPLVVPLILGSLVDVEERALAIEARAFSYPVRKTSLVEIQEANWERMLRLGLTILLALVLAFSVWTRIA
jgi:energy-coupling factor transport system permease protein